MNKNERLKFCKICLNRKFNPKKGLICSLTGEFGDFESDCESFTKDYSIKIEETKKDRRVIIPDKKKHMFLFFTIIFISSIISFLIQKSNFFYSGDQLGNIAIFIFSFFLFSSLFYKLLMPVKLSFVNIKSVSGVLSLISAITIFLFSLAIIINGRLILWGIMLFTIGTYNFIYLSFTKFWNNIYISKSYKSLSVINIVLTTIIFINTILIFLKNSTISNLDNEDSLILIVIVLITLINCIYSFNLLKRK